jgi:hypothetical protein
MSKCRCDRVGAEMNARVDPRHDVANWKMECQRRKLEILLVIIEDD